MADGKRSAPRFTENEKTLLVDLVSRHKHILECKKTDVSSLTAKTETWRKLSNEFNSCHGVTSRDWKQLKKCWCNLKQKWKEEQATQRREVHRTGNTSTHDSVDDSAKYIVVK